MRLANETKARVPASASWRSSRTRNTGNRSPSRANTPSRASRTRPEAFERGRGGMRREEPCARNAARRLGEQPDHVLRRRADEPGELRVVGGAEDRPETTDDRPEWLVGARPVGPPSDDLKRIVETEDARGELVHETRDANP